MGLGRGHAATRTDPWDSQACHLMWHARSAPLTQLRRWIQRSVGPRCHALGARVGGRQRRRRWLVDLTSLYDDEQGKSRGSPCLISTAPSLNSWCSSVWVKMLRSPMVIVPKAENEACDSPSLVITEAHKLINYVDALGMHRIDLVV